jgi:hypothetical protein
LLRRRPRKTSISANYLRIAKASLAETRNHLIDARDRGYLREALYSRLTNLARAAEKATTGLLVQKLRQADAIDGAKRSRRGSEERPPAKSSKHSTLDRKLS